MSSRPPTCGPDLPTAIEDDPERSALLARQQEEVRIANGRLDQRQRLVLALCELEERSYAEIGELVGLNENAVAQLVYRARERLRTELRLVQVDPESLPEECRAFLPLLAQHLDGRLRDPKREQVLSHLEACERCQAALADMREAKRRYRALFLPPLGLSAEDARAAVEDDLERVGYWSGAGAGRGLLRRPRGVAALTAVVAVAPSPSQADSALRRSRRGTRTLASPTTWRSPLRQPRRVRRRATARPRRPPTTTALRRAPSRHQAQGQVKVTPPATASEPAEPATTQASRSRIPSRHPPSPQAPGSRRRRLPRRTRRRRA
jgi:hypothetical protein